MLKAFMFLSRYRDDEKGSATILSLYFSIIILIIGGMAIDFQKRQSELRHLQISADIAAHAALYTVEQTKDHSTAKSTAVATVANSLPYSNMSNIISTSDITFGDWDPATETFTANPSSTDAVRVYTGMTTARGNASPNILLSMIGFDTFDVAADSVYVTYVPPCFREGFVGQDIVDIQSNNTFGSGFCLHSNTHVSINSGNVFEEGSVVSMPNKEDLDLPTSGWESNDGIEAALREGRYHFRVLRKLPAMMAGLSSGTGDFIPDYITSSTINTVSGKFLEPADFTSGRVHMSNCTSGTVTLKPGTYSGVAMVTDCNVKFSNGVILEDATIATTSTNIKSFTAPNGFQLGRDDNCADGGDATLLTLGGFDVAANLSAFNGTILAWDDIKFTAQADGVEGVSFISFGTVEGTSLMNMRYCAGDGMQQTFTADYFRMVD